MEGNFVTDIIIPICLALMMVGLGMTLVPDDFKRVFVYPKAAASGLFFQMIILPLTGFLLASILPIRPEFAVGVMLLAACPGGVASNIITHLAKGDTALAVTLTVISSSLAVLTIPLIMNFSVAHFLGAHSSIQLPLGETVLKVFLLTVPTVATGMVIKNKAAAFAKKTERFVNLGGLLFLIIIIGGVIIHERNNIFGWALQVGPVTAALCIVTMLISYYCSRFIKINVPQSISISIGAGFQNSGLALVIATSFMKSAQVAIPPAVYTFVMYFLAATVVGYMNLRKKSVPKDQYDFNES